MANAMFKFEFPKNEPIRSYAPGTAERESLQAKLAELSNQQIEIPLIIGGKEVKTGNMCKCVMPHNHKHVLATYHRAGEKEVQMAIEASLEARKQWGAMAWEDRLAIFMKAAALLAGPYRDVCNASTMLSQSKNAYQSEIDAACELIDFYRFNCYFATQIYADQPYSPTEMWNRSEYRPLEGFIFAVSPFNFTSIGGNLSTAPAMMGNTVVWKPGSTSVYSAWFVMQVLIEAGLPAGVINFLPGRGADVGPSVITNEHLAGVHFTGSTGVFQNMWKTIGNSISNYHSYPRIVGETGGKDFIFVHESANADEVATAMVRGAFEYQGQKCSAASRAYVPDNLWDDIQDKLVSQLKTVTMGGPEDFSHFVNAVINKSAFDNIKSYIDNARQSPDAEILIGGDCDDSTGYFISPTVILAKKPDYTTMVEEIFGPVLTIYVYPAKQFTETLELCDQTSPYALTGAIFSKDRQAIVQAMKALEQSAGNFYINDKPTGAVVGQQPFGGSRASGTNDKAGSLWNLIRWVAPRTLKETYVPPTDYRYPFMD